jgi:hypothetical protein
MTAAVTARANGSHSRIGSALFFGEFVVCGGRSVRTQPQRQAYEEAGGSIRRYLFAEDENGVFVLDAELLDRLAMENLVTEAKPIRA